MKDIIKLIPGSLEKKLKEMEDRVASLDVSLSIPECPVRSQYSVLLVHLTSLQLLLKVCFEKFGPDCDVYQCGLGHFVCQDCRPMLKVARSVFV